MEQLMLFTYVIQIDYSPESGVMTIADAWKPRGQAAGPASLICSINVQRQGREGAYNELTASVGQFVDIMDSRHSEPF